MKCTKTNAILDDRELFDHTILLPTTNHNRYRKVAILLDVLDVGSSL